MRARVNGPSTPVGGHSGLTLEARGVGHRAQVGIVVGSPAMEVTLEWTLPGTTSCDGRIVAADSPRHTPADERWFSL